MRLKHGAASHVGLIRRQNEDSFVAGGGVYAVCDGMGGARAGEVASETACRVLMRVPQDATEERLAAAVAEANHVIFSQSLAEPSLGGMGTTLTAAIQTGGSLLVAHVGDSRAYLLRDGELTQLTEDHSLVGEMVRRGQLTAAQAAAHPHRSVITRALGTEEEVRPDIFCVDLEPGDHIVICSDGLSSMVEEEGIAAVLGRDDEPQKIAEALVAAALEGGGEDNVTAVVMVVEDDGGSEGLAEGGVASEGSASGSLAEGVPVFGPERRVAPGLLLRNRGEGLDRARGWLRFRRRRVIMAVGIALLLVAVGLAGLAAFNNTVYFVGTTPEGLVALYHGMPQTILGLSMHRLVEVGAAYTGLEAYLKARIDSHELVSKEEGQLFVRSLALQH